MSTSIQGQSNLDQTAMDTAITDTGGVPETSTSLAEQFATMMESAISSQEEEVTTSTSTASTLADQYSLDATVDNAISEENSVPTEPGGESGLDAMKAAMEQQATTTDT